jgi:hypothetical protein
VAEEREQWQRGDRGGGERWGQRLGAARAVARSGEGATVALGSGLTSAAVPYMSS